MRRTLICAAVLAGCSAPAAPPPAMPPPDPATSPLAPGQLVLIHGDGDEIWISNDSGAWTIPPGSVVRVVRSGDRGDGVIGVAVRAEAKDLKGNPAYPVPPNGVVAEIDRANLRPLPQTLPDAAP
jgi:hypothetical protein